MLKLTDGTSLSQDVKEAFKSNLTASYIKFGDTILSYEDYLIKADFSDAKCDPSNGQFIGKAIERELNIEISNEDNKFDLENKEIEYFVGAKLTNGTIKYINFGKFIVQKPENEEVQEKTSFQAFDYMCKFNKPYKLGIALPATYAQIAADACNQCGVQLGNTNFRNANKVVKTNPFINGEQCREVIKSIAKVSFSVAHINQDNKLYFGFDLKETVDEAITTDDYFETKPNDEIKPITTIVLRSSEIPEAGMSVSDANLITQYGENKLIIEEDYLAYTDEIRQELLVAARDLLGLVYTPLSVDLLGSIYLQFNDVIEITNLKGEKLKTYCFNNEHTYNGTLYNTISSIAMTEAEEDYEYQEEELNYRRRTAANIDKANQRITLVTERVDEYEENLSKLEVEVGKISSEVGLIVDLTRDNTANTVVSTENAMQGEALEVNIYGNNSVFEHTRVSENTVVSDNTILQGDSFLKLTNILPGTITDYELLGEHSQETTEGYNLYNPIYSMATNNVTITGERIDNGIKVTITQILDPSVTYKGFYIPFSKTSISNMGIVDGDKVLFKYKIKTTNTNAFAANFGRWEAGTSETHSQTTSNTLTNTFHERYVLCTYNESLTFSAFVFYSSNIAVGDVYEIKDFMVAKSSVDLPFEKYTNGKSPNFKYASDITTLTGNCEVFCSNENLVDDLDGIIENVGGLTTIVENGKLIVSGTPTSNYVNIIKHRNITNLLEDGETYTLIRFGDKGIYNQCSIVYNDGTATAYKHTGVTKTATFKFEKDRTKSVTYGIQTGTIAATGTLERHECNLMIIKGDYSNVDIDYIPHKSNKYPISLGDIELVDASSNTKKYQDKIYFKDDKIILRKELGKVVCDGSSDEGWILEVNANYTRFHKGISGAYAVQTRNVCLSNRFFTVLEGHDISGCFTWGSQIFIYPPEEINTVELLNEELAKTNAVFYYPLQTPTETEITETNYPELYEQLNALRNAETYGEGTTIVVTSSMGDISYEINDNIKEIIYDLKIEDSLKQYGEYADEVKIIEGKEYLIRRVFPQDDGTVIIDEDGQETYIQDLVIPLVDGENILEILNYEALIRIDYVVKSSYTDQFATSVEFKTQILQLYNSISLIAEEFVGKTQIIAQLNVAIKDGLGVIELIGDRTVINSKNFSVTGEGGMTCTSGLIGGWEINANNLLSPKVNNINYCGLVGKSNDSNFKFSNGYAQIFAGDNLGKNGDPAFYVTTDGKANFKSIEMWDNDADNPAYIYIYNPASQVGTRISHTTTESYHVIAGDGGSAPSKGYCMHGYNLDHDYRCHWNGGAFEFYADSAKLATLNGNVSDKRLKKDIDIIKPELIKAIKEVELKQFKMRYGNGKIKFGIIAQELEEIFNKYELNYEDYDFVRKEQIDLTDEETYFSIDYDQLNVLKMKYLEDRVNEQDKLIAKLVEKIDKLEAAANLT